MKSEFKDLNSAMESAKIQVIMGMTVTIHIDELGIIIVEFHDKEEL